MDGHRTSSSYPSGIKVQRAYDVSNRLSTLKDESNNTMATYSYDNLDRTTGVTLANGTSVGYSYDLANRLGYVNNALGGTAREYSYVYDQSSRVTQITEPRGVINTNNYSVRNELQGVIEPSGSPFADETFAYDAGYNRSSWTLGTTTTNYTVNKLNQYNFVSGGAPPIWNTDGGLQQFAGNTYLYDALQRLTEVDYTGGKTLFSYDPLGRRVKKVDENGSGTVLSTVSYHYDGSEVAVEYQPSTTWTYYLGQGLDQVVLRDSGSAKQWYYRDGHGSTSAVTDNSGNVLEQYEYNAQGQFQITNASGTVKSATQIANDILYTGREYDNETGNYFYRARYYNPQLGRFISRDPLSGAEFSQGTNLYAYCANNFLNASDPTGKCWKQILQDFSNFVSSLWGDTTLNNSPGPAVVPSLNPEDLPSVATSIEAELGFGPISSSLEMDTSGGGALKFDVNVGGEGESGVSGALTLNGTVTNGIAPSGTSVTDSASVGAVVGATVSDTTYANGAQSTTVGLGLVEGVSAGSSTTVFSMEIAPPSEEELDEQETYNYEHPGF